MSEIQKKLATLEQKDVKFQGDKIPAVKASDGLVYAPIAPICAYLGLDIRSQRRRINSDDILSEVRRIVAVETASGNQHMVCLPIEFLNGWLFGIQSNRVKSEFRDKIREYKFSCYYQLAKAFSPTAFSEYSGPSIGLNLTLRLADDFNQLKELVLSQQLISKHEHDGLRQMVSQLQHKVKKLEENRGGS